jgi:enoyl-CoA hydratase/carnithine racemase
MSEFISVERTDGVLVLSLNRTAKMNAITEPMYVALTDHLLGAEKDADTRVVVIVAEGDNFTAGNDLSMFAGASPDSPALASVQRFLHTLAGFKKPLVAGVQGQAVGIGVTMLLHCDLVVIAHDAKLVAPFVNLALVPEAASSLLMVQRIGHVRAFSLFALGKAVDGNTAFAWGLANSAVEKLRVREETLALAKALASRAVGSVAATKSLMRNREAMVAQLDAENAQFLERLLSSEAQEVFRAFAEKRPPNFRK